MSTTISSASRNGGNGDGIGGVKTESTNGKSYHDEVESLLASTSSQPFQIARMKDKFLDKALKDLTLSTNASEALQPLSDLSLSDPSNPLLVSQEVLHQKDYFRKLKFKFLEQDAKLQFLGSISGEEAKVLQMGENEGKEQANAEKKKVLKEMKREVEAVAQESCEMSKVVSEEHGQLTQELKETEELSKKIKEIELELARIRSVHPVADRMTTSQAEETLDAQIVEMQNLDDVVKNLNREVDITRDEVAIIAKEVQRLGREKDREEAKAKESRESREKGEVNGVDELCRWYSSSIDLYKQILGIRSVTAISDSELHLEYGSPSPENGNEDSVILALYFQSGTRKLEDAKLLNHSSNIEEAVSSAVGANDVPGLVADVLMRIRQ